MSKVVKGFRFGFSLKYTGPIKSRTPRNLPTVQQNPQAIRDRLQKELKLTRMLGPFATKPFTDLICSPIGLVPKKNTTELRMITHLSHPRGSSINSHINPLDATTHYQTFDDALELVRKCGRFAFLSKADVKSAF